MILTLWRRVGRVFCRKSLSFGLSDVPSHAWVGLWVSGMKAQRRSVPTDSSSHRALYQLRPHSPLFLPLSSSPSSTEWVTRSIHHLMQMPVWMPHIRLCAGPEVPKIAPENNNYKTKCPRLGPRALGTQGNQGAGMVSHHWVRSRASLWLSLVLLAAGGTCWWAALCIGSG